MRLIDADALMIKLKEESSSLYAQTLYAVNNGVKIAMQLVDDAPTIDPVKHGRWIEKKKNAIGVKFSLARCSVCGHGCGYTIAKECFKFCPNCGARMDMDGEEDESND